MKEIVGDNMSIAQLRKFIQDSEVGDQLIILLMLLMGDKEILKVKYWAHLSKSFFIRYRERIFIFCGYGKNKNGDNKIKIEKSYSDLFLSVIGCMIRYDIISHCSYAEMAKQIDAVFDTGHTRNTILNKSTYEAPQNRDYRLLIYSEKKRKKSVCTNKTN